MTEKSYENILEQYYSDIGDKIPEEKVTFIDELESFLKQYGATIAVLGTLITIGVYILNFQAKYFDYLRELSDRVSGIEGKIDVLMQSGQIIKNHPR